MASANCALYCAASIDFVDINKETYNLCPVQLKIKLELAKQKNKLPKVVIPVHLSGQSCDMQAIHQLSVEYGFSIIEDAAHAIGGSYQHQPIGNSQYSDITIFSFHPVKIITTAEGGIAATNNKILADKMRLLRSHGITRDNDLLTDESHGEWYYQQLDLGFNYRMSDLQAALGVSQSTRLKEFVSERLKRANYYQKELVHLPITLPHQTIQSTSSWHLYIIRLQLDNISKTHQQVFHELRKAGILVNLHYIPVHIQPYYQQLGFKLGDFPNAEQYYKEAISIPLYSHLSQQDQDLVITTLQNILL